MTGSELKTFAENILDGQTIGEDFFYQLLNIAKTKLEEGRAWNYLKKLDSSNTSRVGYDTTGYNLPSDFSRDYKVMLGDSVEITPVPFEEQHAYKYAPNGYYLDIVGDKFYLTGNVGSVDTIHFYYLRYTPDITANSSPVFPARFHFLLAFEVAGYYMNGIDSDDQFARMSPENKAAYSALKQAMVSWDSNLSARARNNQIGMTEVSGISAGIDLGKL